LRTHIRLRENMDENYIVNENGTIFSVRAGIYLKQQTSSRGYASVRIYAATKMVHRLVAIKYLPNPENKPFINHIDHNKLNNYVDNLEWCTPQENSLASIEFHANPTYLEVSKRLGVRMINIMDKVESIARELSLEYDELWDLLRDEKWKFKHKGMGYRIA